MPPTSAPPTASSTVSSVAPAADAVPATPVGRVELGHAATAELRELILSGAFAPGERLIESELAARFGTSRGPVRDAIASLEHTGLVATLPRGGACVARMTVDDVEELYSLRLALEELAVRRAVPRLDEGALAHLGAALDDLAAALRRADRRAVAAADMRFHRAIIDASGHQRLRAAWEAVSDQTLLVMHRLPAVEPEVQSDVGHHRDVLAALAARDADRAVSEMRQHLEAARDAMVAHYARLA